MPTYDSKFLESFKILPILMKAGMNERNNQLENANKSMRTNNLTIPSR